MSDTAALPRLAALYNLKNSVLRAIYEQGANSLIDEADAAQLGVSGSFTLGTLLESINKMIEALAALRDFSKEPISEAEQQDLDEIWQIEEYFATQSQIEAVKTES